MNSAHDEPAPRKKKPVAPRRRQIKTHATPKISPHAVQRRKTKPAALPIRQPPPPRAADPLARQTGKRLAYYTPEFLAEAKRRVEQTLQSTNAIAADFGMDHGPLWRLIRRYGWVRPEGALRRPRGLSPVMRLAMETDALVASPPPGGGRSASEASRVGVIAERTCHPTPALTDVRADPPPPEPATGRAAPAARPGGEGTTETAAPASLDNATIERLEAAVLEELARVETMRASLGAEPQRPADAAHTARTLASLTDTLSKLRRMRLAAQPQQDTSHDDMPADIDEFRNELARRIRALVASRTGRGDADSDRAAVAQAPQS